MTVHRTDTRCSLRHELLLHDGPAQLVDLSVPVFQDAAAQGYDVLVMGDADFIGAMTDASDAPIEPMARVADTHHPGRDLHEFERFFARRHAAGRQSRVVRQMPAVTPDDWPEWRRYEAAVNVVLGPFDLWTSCAYDVGRLKPDMVEDLLASHSHVRADTGEDVSAEFARLNEHLPEYLRTPPHPLAGMAPDLGLEDPSAAIARAAVRDLAARAQIDPVRTEAAVLAVSETVSNAWRHGRPPVGVRAWVREEQLTVAVSDSGRGPDPLVGLLPLPAREAGSGRGTWLVHELLGDLHHHLDDGGYTVTFTTG
jgi:anti-sigma regulatory factor (Ser/Thr protein kinase)